MKKHSILPIVALIFAGFTSAAGASPISLTFKVVGVTEEGTELRRIEALTVQRPTTLHESTKLKLWGYDRPIPGGIGGVGSPEYFETGNVATAAASGFIQARVRPIAGTQAMALPTDVTMAMPLGPIKVVSAATGLAPAARGDNTANDQNAVVVGEPGTLLLFGFGLIAAGLARRRH